MLLWMLSLAMLGADAPQLEVTTLKGETVVGGLVSYSDDALVIRGPTSEVKIPAEDLLELRTKDATRAAAGSTAPSAKTPIVVQLVDGARLAVTGLQTDTATDQTTLLHPTLGPLKCKTSTLRSARYAAADAKMEPLWLTLFDRNVRKDLLVVRKGDVLDHLDGVIGSITEQNVKFSLDGDEIPVKREKIFGLIWNRKSTPAVKLRATVELLAGDRLQAQKVSWNSGQWQVTVASFEQPFAIPAAAIYNLDFGIGKIQYLSALEPRDVRYSTLLGEDLARWQSIFGIRRDTSFEGRPLQVGGKTYPRGLAIHSRTELRYRLGSDYRRFQAMMAIDDEILSGGVTAVTIAGDGKALYQGEVRPGQAPVPLDLDVANVVELTILVDYGSDKDEQGDRLHLADAKLVK